MLSAYLPLCTFTTHGAKGPEDAQMAHFWRAYWVSPTYEEKCSDSIRWSHHTGKGSGGAAEQLQKISDIITTVQSKKMRDGFKDAGEVPNPMVPKSPTTKRVKRYKVFGVLCHADTRTFPQLSDTEDHSKQ